MTKVGISLERVGTESVGISSGIANIVTNIVIFISRAVAILAIVVRV